jgi:hypothetical protein
MKLALTIYKSLIRSALTHAAKTLFKKLQNFQNKVLRIITKLPRVTPIDTLYDQTDMETVSRYVARTASKFYFKNQFSEINK